MPNINVEQILTMLPHRYPFLFIDKVLKYKKGYIETRKNVTINEPYFQGHFPSRPILPGVILIEMAAQSAALMYILDSIKFEENTELTIDVLDGKAELANKVGYLASVKNFKFMQIVSPGDILCIKCQSKAKLGKLLEIDISILDERNKNVASGRLLVSENED